ncbi:hypothetical protein K438DRAFT_1764787 [Mycena galopus ATCC 62051]|nr:hypothetical protein K438DRAFT_1764787 [Mycena galopus ATCC 62051]
MCGRLARICEVESQSSSSNSRSSMGRADCLVPCRLPSPQPWTIRGIYIRADAEGLGEIWDSNERKGKQRSGAFPQPWTIRGIYIRADAEGLGGDMGQQRAEREATQRRIARLNRLAKLSRAAATLVMMWRALLHQTTAFDPKRQFQVDPLFEPEHIGRRRTFWKLFQTSQQPHHYPSFGHVWSHNLPQINETPHPIAPPLHYESVFASPFDSIIHPSTPIITMLGSPQWMRMYMADKRRQRSPRRMSDHLRFEVAHWNSFGGAWLSLYIDHRCINMHTSSPSVLGFACQHKTSSSAAIRNTNPSGSIHMPRNGSIPQVGQCLYALVYFGFREAYPWDMKLYSYEVVDKR